MADQQLPPQQGPSGDTEAVGALQLLMTAIAQPQVGGGPGVDGKRPAEDALQEEDRPPSKMLKTGKTDKAQKPASAASNKARKVKGEQQHEGVAGLLPGLGLLPGMQPGGAMLQVPNNWLGVLGQMYATGDATALAEARASGYVMPVTLQWQAMSPLLEAHLPPGPAQLEVPQTCSVGLLKRVICRASGGSIWPKSLRVLVPVVAQPQLRQEHAAAPQGDTDAVAAVQGPGQLQGEAPQQSQHAGEAAAAAQGPSDVDPHAAAAAAAAAAIQHEQPHQHHQLLFPPLGLAHDPTSAAAAAAAAATNMLEATMTTVELEGDDRLLAEFGIMPNSLILMSADFPAVSPTVLSQRQSMMGIPPGLQLDPAMLSYAPEAMAAMMAAHQSQMEGAGGKSSGSRAERESVGKERFTDAEMEALVSGIEEHGLKWAVIQKTRSELERKKQGDLKDKWRNWQRNVASEWATSRVKMEQSLKERINALVAAAQMGELCNAWVRAPVNGQKGSGTKLSGDGGAEPSGDDVKLQDEGAATPEEEAAAAAAAAAAGGLALVAHQGQQQHHVVVHGAPGGLSGALLGAGQAAGHPVLGDGGDPALAAVAGLPPLLPPGATVPGHAGY